MILLSVCANCLPPGSAGLILAGVVELFTTGVPPVAPPPVIVR